MRLLFVACVAVLAVVADSATTLEQCKTIIPNKMECVNGGVLPILQQHLGMKKDISIKKAIGAAATCMQLSGMCKEIPEIIPREKPDGHQAATAGAVGAEHFLDEVDNHGFGNIAKLVRQLNNPTHNNPELKKCIDELVEEVEKDEISEECANTRGINRIFGSGKPQKKHPKALRLGHGVDPVFKVIMVLTKAVDQFNRHCDPEKLPEMKQCFKQRTGIDVELAITNREEIRKASCELKAHCKNPNENQNGLDLITECIDLWKDHHKQRFLDNCGCKQKHVKPLIDQCQAKVPNLELPEFTKMPCPQKQQTVLTQFAEFRDAMDICKPTFSWDKMKQQLVKYAGEHVHKYFPEPKVIKAAAATIPGQK